MNTAKCSQAAQSVLVLAGYSYFSGSNKSNYQVAMNYFLCYTKSTQGERRRKKKTTKTPVPIRCSFLREAEQNDLPVCILPVLERQAGGQGQAAESCNKAPAGKTNKLTKGALATVSMS